MHKKITWMAVIVMSAVASPAGLAQTTGNGVHIYTEPQGLYFLVDGQPHLSAVDLLWPANSKHVITAHDQSSIQPGTLFAFGNIYTNLSPSPVADLPVTADPALKWVKIVFNTSYLLTISLPDCGNSQLCLSGGRIEVNGQLYDRRTQMYIAAGSGIHARAFPNSGYIFTGWGTVWQLGHPTQFDITFPMSGTLTLAAFFSPANAVQAQVNIITKPPQLRVFLDRTPYVAPVSLEWGWGTTHTLGTDPVQLVQGATYVFDSWSDGGAINHDLQVPSQSGSISLTATFVPATKVDFLTSPPGLTLSIDGRTNWPDYYFAWAPGSAHQVLAPATQSDAQGHKYRFVSWSNGRAAAFNYTAGPAPGNDRITAVYQVMGQARVTTDPPGLSLEVDGTSCTTPCTIEKDAGSTAQLSAQPLQDVTDQSRLVFQGWGDSAGTARVIVLTPDLKEYCATYAAQNRLVLSAAPSEGAAFSLSPTSTDGFYDAGALVSVAAKLALGFRVSGWSGDLAGKSTSVALTLDSPKNATLVLDRVPAISQLGVQNAAAGASIESVAPGSLISIFGANLAPGLLVGPANPLAQTLETVTVRTDDAFLPLVYVSPEQINAQLPASISEGKHSIVVRWEGRPEAVAPISVVRNAPGLFNTGPQSEPVGFFVRTDGSAITKDTPARPGEVISVLGTGLGPYVMAPPDGFLLDDTAGYTLVDSVTVVLGEDTSLDPLYAGRSGVGVGVDSVRFQLPASLPDSNYLPIRIRINDKESNTVLLPVAQQSIQP